jgi:signal transduction histidine kinase
MGAFIMGKKLYSRSQFIPSHARLTPFRLKGFWSLLASLILFCFGIVIIFSVQQIRKEQEIQLKKQIDTLTRSRIRDLERGNLRQFIEGMGTDFQGDFIIAKEGEKFHLQTGQMPKLPICIERLFSGLSWDSPLELQICRPLEFPYFLTGFSLLSILLLCTGCFYSIRRVEKKALRGFRKLIQERGIPIHEEQSFSGFLEKLEEIQKELDQARKSELELVRLQSYSELSRQVIHDIRSPIAALNVLSESDDLPEEEKTLLATVSNKLKEITQDLHEQGKDLREEKISLDEEEKSNLVSLLQELKKEKELEFKKSIKVTLLFGPETERVNVPIKRITLSRILSNIVNNAVEANSSEVLVETKHENSECFLTISDNGKGISQDQLERVLEKGYSFEKSSGTGLGLSYAKEVMENSGGHLKISSRLGQGTQITLKFLKASS